MSSLPVCVCVSEKASEWVSPPYKASEVNSSFLSPSLPLSQLGCYCQTGLGVGGGQSSPTAAAAAAGVFCVVWTFSRFGGSTDTHTHAHTNALRSSHAWYYPRLSCYPLSLWHTHTHTQKERRCVSGGSCGARWREETRAERSGGRLYHASAGRKADGLFVSLLLELEVSASARTAPPARTRTRWVTAKFLCPQLYCCFYVAMRWSCTAATHCCFSLIVGKHWFSVFLLLLYTSVLCSLNLTS